MLDEVRGYLEGTGIQFTIKCWKKATLLFLKKISYLYTNTSRNSFTNYKRCWKIVTLLFLKKIYTSSLYKTKTLQ